VPRLREGSTRSGGAHARTARGLSITDLLAALHTWRTRAAESAGLPEFCIFTDSALIAIAESSPRNADQLAEVSGVGPAKIRKYGADVLALLAAGTPGPDAS
jgi:DNA helicase-2/ATP-dependent DNA helicase PcrA